MIDMLFKGVGWTDIALLLNRAAVGAFFMFSGYHKLFNPQRHQVFLEGAQVASGAGSSIQPVVGAERGV